MSFKSKKYKIIRNAIPEVLAHFVADYFCIKKEVAATMFNNKYISPFSTDFGTWNDEQVPNTYSHYADVAMETLLLGLLPKMEKESGMKLVPTYSYARIYKNGDILRKHKDRFSCEISATMNLGGQDWPIFIEPDSKKGKFTSKGYQPSNSKGTKVILKAGDMLMYYGCLLEHWREPFNGDVCAQVFLHYNKKGTKNSNEFDGRPHLGLPHWFKNVKT